jgi:hypothetical protein
MHQSANSSVFSTAGREREGEIGRKRERKGEKGSERDREGEREREERLYQAP